MLYVTASIVLVGCMDTPRCVQAKPNKVLIRSKASIRQQWGHRRQLQSSAFCKMNLRGGVGPDGDFSRLGKCELILSLVEIRVTNTASLQIAIRVIYHALLYSHGSVSIVRDVR